MYKRGSARTRIPAVVVPRYRLTLHPEGAAAANFKNMNKPNVVAVDLRLRTGRQVLSIIWWLALCLATLSAVSVLFLQQRFPYSPHLFFGFVRYASGLRGAPSSSFFPRYGPPGHEPFGCFEDIPVQLARFRHRAYGAALSLLLIDFHRFLPKPAPSLARSATEADS